MKFFYPLLLILCFSSIGYSQHNVDMKAIQEKMKMAQAMIDSLKKTNPMLRNVQVPNVQKMVAANNSRMAKLQSIQAAKQKDLSNALPQRKNVSVASVSKLTAATLVALAQKRLAEVQGYLDPDMRKYLDEMAKNTHSNIAGAGILASTFGLPKYVGDYLICKGVLRNPTNLWAINDLGISFRQSHQYKEAAQCFLYALQFEKSSMVLNTNAGWASAYYGDLNAAKNYFQQAVNVKQDLSPAMEGLATVNYQLGDSGSLKNCLKQELMFMSAGGAGPSMEFASVCGGVMDPDFQVS
jgi:tetratricopeptide (TPR) repeat protein